MHAQRAIDAGRAIGPNMFTTGPYLTGQEGSQTMAAVSFGWPHVICGLKTLLETDRAIDFSAAEPGCPGQGSATASA